MNSIRGFMLDGDYAAIEKICEPFLNRNYVTVFEVGTLYGKSAVAFDDCLASVAHSVTTLDVCEGWTGPPEELMDTLELGDEFRQQVYANRSTAEEQFDEVMSNIKDRPINFRAEKFDKWYPCPSKVPNIAFYDGSHSYQETKDFLDYWYSKMSNGDVISVDDYGVGEWHGVKEAVDEFCSEHKLTIDHYENSKIISITLRGIGML